MDKTTPTLSRRDREREQHRIDILDAAELVFVRDGDAAKVETIAQEAEYSVGSIYNFFPRKEDLFKSVLLRISQLRAADIRSNFDSLVANPWQGLRMICRFWIEHHQRHGSFLDVARSQWLRPHRGNWLPPDDPIEVEIMRNLEEYRKVLSDFFKALLRTDEARNLDADVMFITFEGYIRTSYVTSSRGRGDGIDAEKLEADVYQALCMLFRK